MGWEITHQGSCLLCRASNQLRNNNRTTKISRTFAAETAGSLEHKRQRSGAWPRRQRQGTAPARVGHRPFPAPRCRVAGALPGLSVTPAQRRRLCWAAAPELAGPQLHGRRLPQGQALHPPFEGLGQGPRLNFPPIWHQRMQKLGLCCRSVEMNVSPSHRSGGSWGCLSHDRANPLPLNPLDSKAKHHPLQ